MKNEYIVIGAVLILAIFGSQIMSVYPLDNAAYVGIPFNIRFFSGTYEITHSGTCPTDSNGQAFLIQNIQTKDDNTGEIWTALQKNAQPSCAATSYQWPDFSFTPLYAHHYTITSTIKDGTTNNVLNTDTWPFQVQNAPATPVCTPGQKKCDMQSEPDRLVICGSEGQYTEWGDFCPGGCVDDNSGGAYCAQVCTPGSYKCTSEVQYQLCNNDGTNWGDSFICGYTWPLPTLCIDGQANPCVQQLPICGDGICSPGETSTSCGADCATGTVCGDGTCSAGETAQSCRADCDVCWQNPANMPIEQFCQCFPTSTQCAGSPDNNLLLLLGGGFGLIIIGGIILYLVTRRRK